MKHYWMHFKEDKERGLRESWYLTLSFASPPSSGWLYRLDDKEWRFRIYNSKRGTDMGLNVYTKREAMKRCVAILKLLNEMENRNKERKEQC